MDWKLKQPFSHNTTLYNYWGFDDEGDVVNGIVLGDVQVKELQKDSALSELGVLPLFISPVGGLPDRGAIDGKWQEHFGESIVATNEELTKNYNKMLSFMQQLARTVAQPHYLELSIGETPIMTEENMSKWGTILRGAPGESAGAIQPPIIPVELRTMMFEYSNMIQRGFFPWALFGNIQMQMSYLAMANIASAALQVLTPYMDAFKGLRSDIDNYHYKMLKLTKFKPHKFVMPENMPEEVEFDVQADIEIPGYLVQRATVARMLDPTFRLSTETVMDKMFPEVRDPLREQAKTRKDDAMSHPKAILGDQILAYKEQARILREADDIEAAEIYELLAESIKAELTATVPLQPGATPRGLPAAAREVVPPTEVAPPVPPIEGMGEI